MHPAQEVPGLGLGFFGVPLLLLLGTEEADDPLTNHVVAFRTTLGSLAKSEVLLKVREFDPRIATGLLSKAN